MNTRRCGAIAFLAILAMGGISPGLHAETIVLYPGSGSPNQIQDAIDAGQDGDVIILEAGVWEWGVDYQQIDFKGKGITLEGVGLSSTGLSVVQKPEDTPAILVRSGEYESTRIRNLNFYGYEEAVGNILEVVDSHPVLDDCKFYAMEGKVHPAIRVVDGGLTIHDCRFYENWMGESSIVSAENSTLVMTESQFINCGEYHLVSASNCLVYISDNRFQHTFAPRTRKSALEFVDSCGRVIDNVFYDLKTDLVDTEPAGIDVYSSDGSLPDFCLNIHNCTFDYMRSRNTSAAIRSSVPVFVVSSTFIECSSSGVGTGGAVNLENGGVVADCLFTECYAYNGGGLGATGNTLVWASRFIDNFSNQGGGVFGTMDRMTFLGCEFEGNTATDSGGAIWASLNARQAGEFEYPVSIHACMFTNNESRQNGGPVGFGDEVGNALVDGCTFSDNPDQNGNPEAFGYSDEDGALYEVFVKDTFFCPSLTTSRAYMNDLGGNLIDIKCAGETVNSIFVGASGRPRVFQWHYPIGWTQVPLEKNQIMLFDPSTGGMEDYFITGDDWGATPGIDGFARIDQRRLIMSFANNGQPDGLEDPPEDGVTSSDILMFTANELGSNSDGTWSMYFDGSDVGLVGGRSNIDALAIISDGSLIMSLRGPMDLEGLGRVDDSALLRFLPTSLGSDTQGEWQLLFGPEYSDFRGSGEDIDAVTVKKIAYNAWTFYFSSLGRFTVDGVDAENEDVLDYVWFPSGNTAPQGSVHKLYDGVDDLQFGYSSGNITALDWIGDW